VTVHRHAEPDFNNYFWLAELLAICERFWTRVRFRA